MSLLNALACELLLLFVTFSVYGAGVSGHKARYGAPKTSTKQELNFLVIADWGGIPIWPYITPDEISVSQQMAAISDDIDSKFVLAFGDNFYEDGVKDVDDKRFKQTFEDVFTAPSLQIPWYVVAGNHDHRGNISGQIAYSQKSKRWNFPSEYYRLNFKVPGNGATLTVLMIDTVVLCGGSHDDVPGCDLPGPDNPQVAETQWDWIENELKNSMHSDYVIVGGHYPVWSIAEHGPTGCLVDRLRPMLLKYNVTAYFSGHDHNLQHIQESNTSLDVFVIGSANVVDPSIDHMDSVPADWVKFYYAQLGSLGGFAYVSVTSDRLQLTFASGAKIKNLYSVDLMPRLNSK